MIFGAMGINPEGLQFCLAEVHYMGPKIGIDCTLIYNFGLVKFNALYSSYISATLEYKKAFDSQYPTYRV